MNNKSSFELKTVLETSRILVESRDSSFILNNLLLIIMGRLLVTKTAVFIHDASTSGRYTIKGAKGVSKQNTQESFEITVSPENREHSYISLESVTGLEEIIPDDEREKFKLFNLRTMNRHHGYLLLGPKADKNPFYKHELEFVEGLCLISTAALVNSELFAELRKTHRNLDRRIHELNTLFDLSKEFNVLTDREQIARIFKLTLLGQLFIRTFFLVYQNDDKPRLITSNGLSNQPDLNEIEHIFNDVQSDLTVSNWQESEKHPWITQNGISVLIPISIQNRQVALIGVGQRVNKIDFNENDINFLKSLANLAVISIQKTFFLEEQIDMERMEEELLIAKSIQMGLLPDPVPKIPGTDLASKTVSSREVGGDYFDVATTPDGSTILSIADVTGKGVPAALLMANLQSMLHVLLPVDISLDEATERMNSIIFKNTPADKFITFFWAKYNSSNRSLSYVNAGHNPPLLLRNGSEEFEELTEGGLLLGALESALPYKETVVQLSPGDLLVCYTDGVTEASPVGREDEEFGEERLQETVLRCRNLPSSEILDTIIADVNTYSNHNISDDLTLLILKISE